MNFELSSLHKFLIIIIFKANVITIVTSHQSHCALQAHQIIMGSIFLQFGELCSSKRRSLFQVNFLNP